jgi:hypothetical protein
MVSDWSGRKQPLSCFVDILVSAHSEQPRESNRPSGEGHILAPIPILPECVVVV